MANPSNLQHRSLPVKLMSLFLALLTGCSSTTSTYSKNGKAIPMNPELARGVQYLDHWGSATPPNMADPTMVPGMLIAMHSLADPKLDGDYRIGFDGMLVLPYDVTLNTSGFILSDLKKKLGELYRPYFKTPSDIDLRVKENRYWVDVRGLVDKPGRYLVEPEASLDYVIGQAGGFSKEDRPLYVRIQKGPKLFVFDLNEYYSQGEDHPQIQGWLGGEVLFFQKEPSGGGGPRNAASPYRMPVYMLGEVRKPGGYTVLPNGDFLDSVVQAGGFTEHADLDNIELVRRTGGAKRIYNFSWKDVQTAPTPIEGDVFMIHPDNISKFERHAGLVATLIGAFATVITSVVLVLAYNRGRV